MFLIPIPRTANALSRSFDRLFDDSFLDRVFAPAALTDPGMRNPALDVVESEHAFTVTLEMPGVTKEDVKVTIDGRRVTVQAQASTQEEKKQGDRIVYSERALSSYARSFTLPAEVDQRESGAKLEHGVLTLTLAKRGPAAGAQITIS